QEFQLARGYTPLATGLRLLPFFATPMIISPLAGALSDRIGRRPIMLAGLMLQALGYLWVAARGSVHISWIDLSAPQPIRGTRISPHSSASRSRAPIASHQPYARRPSFQSQPDQHPKTKGRTMPNNIEIITRFELGFRAGDQATIDELADPNLVDHNASPDSG